MSDANEKTPQEEYDAFWGRFFEECKEKGLGPIETVAEYMTRNCYSTADERLAYRLAWTVGQFVTFLMASARGNETAAASARATLEDNFGVKAEVTEDGHAQFRQYEFHRDHGK